MQLVDHREILGRWLQDTTGRQWSSTILTKYVNLGLRELEKHLLSFDPESFKCIYTADTTVPTTGKDNIYSYPVGTFAVHEIAYSSDGLNYTPIERRSLRNIRDFRGGGFDTEWGYVPYDAGHFILWPSPTTAISSALRIIVAPTLGMAEDTDEFPAPLAFETLSLLETKKWAAQDVGESTDNLQEEINRLKTETPRFFLTDSSPAFIQPLVDRGY